MEEVVGTFPECGTIYRRQIYTVATTVNDP
jgi:hypothetical protein